MSPENHTALPQLARDVASALGEDWGVMDTSPPAAPSGTVALPLPPTRLSLVNQRGNWWVDMDVLDDANRPPGWVTVRLADHTEPFYHDKIDWSALPPGPGQLMFALSTAPSELAQAISAQLLTDAARNRQYAIKEAALAAARQHDKAQGAGDALAATIEDSFNSVSRTQAFSYAAREAGTLTPKVQREPDGELRVAGLDGVAMRPSDIDRVRLSIRDRYVSANTAALVALLLYWDRQADQ